MALNRMSSDFQSAYEQTDREFSNLYQSSKKSQQYLDALERIGVDFYGFQVSFNNDLNRRILQLQTDIRNNRTYRVSSHQEQLERLEELELNTTAWLEEVKRLEAAVKNISEERSEKIVEQKDISDRLKKLLDELELQLKEMSGQIALYRTATMALSAGLVLIVGYLTKLF